MASVFQGFEKARAAPPPWVSELMRRDRAIGTPLFDALLFWGAPPLALILVTLLGLTAAQLPPAAGAGVIAAMSGGIGILTYAHLIAVVPRAYLNRDVFRAHRARLTLVPIVLVAALALSPALLVIGMVTAILWDVHHTAMQNFGLGRIYDMKAGNDPNALRRIDLILNAALYIGPLAAGASLLAHFEAFGRFDMVGWHQLTLVPAGVSQLAGAIRVSALIAWAGAMALALHAYARAAKAGYRSSAHKRALLLGNAVVSIVAWVFAPPLLAFAIVNLFHAVQYFGIVWLKEGGRMRELAPRARRIALPLFLAACAAFGAAYWLAASRGIAAAGALLAPFIACSLLHFWYDGFVWSVRRELV